MAEHEAGDPRRPPPAAAGRPPGPERGRAAGEVPGGTGSDAGGAVPDGQGAEGAQDHQGAPDRKASQGGRSGGRRAVLALACAAQFMVILDVSVVNVALPSIKDSLGFDAVALQWVVGAYAIAFASLLLLGGRLADLYGRRRVFALRARAVLAVQSGRGARGGARRADRHAGRPGPGCRRPRAGHPDHPDHHLRRGTGLHPGAGHLDRRQLGWRRGRQPGSAGCSRSRCPGAGRC